MNPAGVEQTQKPAVLAPASLTAKARRSALVSWRTTANGAFLQVRTPEGTARLIGYPDFVDARAAIVPQLSPGMTLEAIYAHGGFLSRDEFIEAVTAAVEKAPRPLPMMVLSAAMRLIWTDGRKSP